MLLSIKNHLLFCLTNNIHSSFAIILTSSTQIPFRETHHISGRAVALAESRSCQLNELTLADYKTLNDKFSEDVHEVFDFEASVERRQAIGGPSRKMIDRQIAVLREALRG